MGGAPRSEAVAVLGKRRVPALLENLQHRLLDQAVDDARDAELSDPAVRFGYLDPLHRLRLIGSLEQLFPNGWPVLPQVVHRRVDGHPIHAGTTLVLPHAFPRSFEVVSFAHLLHQSFFAPGFGCLASPRAVRSLRRPADWGFTPCPPGRPEQFWVFCRFPLMRSRVLLATPDRSGLRPAFPARPIRCSAFRRWSASLALPTAWPTMPSADFCAAVRSHLVVVPCTSPPLASRERPDADLPR